MQCVERWLWSRCTMCITEEDGLIVNLPPLMHAYSAGSQRTWKHHTRWRRSELLEHVEAMEVPKRTKSRLIYEYLTLKCAVSSSHSELQTHIWTCTFFEQVLNLISCYLFSGPIQSMFYVNVLNYSWTSLDRDNGKWQFIHTWWLHHSWQNVSFWREKFLSRCSTFPTLPDSNLVLGCTVCTQILYINSPTNHHTYLCYLYAFLKKSPNHSVKELISTDKMQYYWNSKMKLKIRCVSWVKQTNLQQHSSYILRF